MPLKKGSFLQSTSTQPHRLRLHTCASGGNLFKTQKVDGANVSYNINYVYVENAPQNLEAGENILNFSNKTSTDTDRSHVNGKRKFFGGQVQQFTGNTGEIYKGSDNLTIMHETGHFIGLSDRYDDLDLGNLGGFNGGQFQSEIHAGFKGDLMGDKTPSLNPLYSKQFLDKANSINNGKNTIRGFLQIGRDTKGNLLTPYEEGGKHSDSPYKKSDEN